MSQIELRGVSKYYKKLAAAREISLSIGEGEALGLVGESGCGKSTVAGIIAGLLRADEGTLLYDGRDIRSLDRAQRTDYRRNVQMVFQDSASALNPRLTVGNCIAEPIENFLRPGKAETRTMVQELLRQVGLSAEDDGRYPAELSGGQRQRVCIARAIAAKPRFLLLDEVTANLDVSVQAQILNLLRDLGREHGMGCLMISHDIGVVRYLCDTIAVMYRGRIVERMPEAQLQSAQHPYTRLLLASVPTIRRNILADAALPQEEAASEAGCDFYARCPVRREPCREHRPPLEPCGDGHQVACFAPQTTPEGDITCHTES